MSQHIIGQVKQTFECKKRVYFLSHHFKYVLRYSKELSRKTFDLYDEYIS